MCTNCLYDTEAFQQDLRKKNREFRGSSSRDLSKTMETPGTKYRDEYSNNFPCRI